MKLRYPVAERKGAHTAGNVEPKAAQVTESRFYENALHFIKNYENLKKILGNYNVTEMTLRPQLLHPPQRALQAFDETLFAN